MKIKRIFALPVAALLLLLMGAGPAFAGTTIAYTGQGFNYDGTTYNLNDERCGVGVQNAADDGGTGQFADWNGPGEPYEQGQGYLLWVLTANGAGGATLQLPGGGPPVNMIKVGGTFKYASAYYNRDDLVNLPVTATYTGKAKGNVQLVVSHGCQPYDPEDGAWCSPGYWKNASAASWALIGVDKSDLFNEVVVPDFYIFAHADDPTLDQVLTTPGANTFGAAAAPYGLNAFNATGAALTNRIPGFDFDLDLYSGDDDETACPIDNHGNYKFP